MNKKYLLLDIVNMLVSFLVCRYVFIHYLYFQYYHRVVLSMPELDILGPLAAILIMSYSVFVFLSCFYREKVSRKKIAALYALYVASLVYLLLFKNVGIRGFELNPIENLRDIQAGSIFVSLMNVLMFVPLGTLITSKKQFLLACLGVIGVEFTQYLFSLGICDTGDVFLNILGLLLGVGLAKSGLLKPFLQKID